MNLFAEGGPWLTILFFSVLFLVIFRRPLGWLLKLLARSALGLGFLALWSQSGLAAESMQDHDKTRGKVFVFVHFRE